MKMFTYTKMPYQEEILLNARLQSVLSDPVKMGLFVPNTKITVLGSVIVHQGSLGPFVKGQFALRTLADMEEPAWAVKLDLDFYAFAQ